MPTKQELLLKIKALAERGIGGERDSAQELLSELMEKYGITEEELETEHTQTTWFRFKDDMECRILNQIIYMVTGKMSFGCVGTYSNGKHKKRGIDCTASERLEIEMNYDFFNTAIKEEFNTFFLAFCNKNSLFPSKSKVAPRDINDLSSEEKERALKASLMAKGIDRHTLKKQLMEGS